MVYNILTMTVLNNFPDICQVANVNCTNEQNKSFVSDLDIITIDHELISTPIFTDNCLVDFERMR